MYHLGIDVSKAKLDCSLLTNSEKEKFHYKKVSNSEAGFEELLRWLKGQKVVHDEVRIIMEGTGAYHQKAAYAFYNAGLKVSIVNPATARNFAKGLSIRTKNDKVDSEILARFGKAAPLECWSPPAPEARILEELRLRLHALEDDLRRERNRKEKTEVTLANKIVIKSIDESISFLEKQCKKLAEQIKKHIDRHPNLKEDHGLLTSIPAIGVKAGTGMLALMRTHNFTSGEQCTSFMGLFPVEKRSGTSVNARPKLAKNGPADMRALLYMPALVAIRSNPHIKALYERLLERGKPKKVAICAAMRKLVHLCFGVLKTRIPYDPNYGNSL